jgi:putative tryptophan/tyrosine transport system substrate-binding protein
MAQGFEVEVAHATARSSAAGYRCDRLAHRGAPADERRDRPGYRLSWQRAGGRVAGALSAIRRGLSETGFTEGKNIVIEYRWADDHYDRLPALAVELAQKDIAILVAPGSVAAAKAAMAATRTIPIVFMIASDPVEAGLVSSFNHPGANVTGEGYLNAQVAPKRLQLLHEAVPAAAPITRLVNPANPVEAESQTKELQAAAAALGLQLRVAEVTTLDEVERVFTGSRAMAKAPFS